MKGMKRARDSSLSVVPMPSGKRVKRSRAPSRYTDLLLEGDDDDDGTAAAFATLSSVSDTLACMRVLKHRAREYKMPFPFILKSVLYGMMGSHTAVDRELSSLLSLGDVKSFEVLKDEDEWILLFTGDWIATLEAAKRDAVAARLSCREEERKERGGKPNIGRRRTHDDSPEHIALVFDAFLRKVVPVYHESTIEEKELLKLMRKGDHVAFTSDDLTPLVNCGALLFRDTNLYGFGVPGAGPFLVTCEKGRKELLRLVKECPFQQIPLERVLSKKPRTSKIPFQYHIHSAIGAQLLEQVDSADGAILRVVPC